MGNRRTFEGIVISDRMDKTITVELKRLIPHPLYKKVVKRRSRVKAHDSENKAKVGDIVKVIESRLFSKTKSWELVEILKRAVGSE
jgi:small subunit ribosomal protein S17